MWMRLALALGCSVREAQARVSSAEFAEWCAYYQLEPSGPFSEWARWAQMMALLANVHRRPGTRPARAQDFMPKPPQTSEDHLRILRVMFPPKHG